MVDPTSVNVAATAIVDSWLANLVQGLILMIASSTGVGIVFVFKSLNAINLHLAKLNGRTKSMEEWQIKHETMDNSMHEKIEEDIERIDKHIMDELITRARAAESDT
jgi:peroxiredoxin family protein